MFNRECDSLKSFKKHLLAVNTLHLTFRIEKGMSEFERLRNPVSESDSVHKSKWAFFHKFCEVIKITKSALQLVSLCCLKALNIIKRWCVSESDAFRMTFI